MAEICSFLNNEIAWNRTRLSTPFYSKCYKNPFGFLFNAFAIMGLRGPLLNRYSKILVELCVTYSRRNKKKLAFSSEFFF